jgi:hypothetical protein
MNADPIGKSLPVSQAGAAAAPKEIKEAEEKQVDTTDRVEVGEKKKGLMGRVKDFAATDMKASKEAEVAYADGSIMSRYKPEIIAAATGGVVGGVIGGVVAHNAAMNEVRSLPVNSVSLEWDKPVMADKAVGRMPADYYEPANIWGFFHENTLIDVVKEAPVRNPDGSVQMQHVEKTFTEHGKPIVRWDVKDIGDPQMKGYHESRWEDGHWHREVVGHDSNGRPIEKDVWETDGWRHTFSPDIDYKKVGEYKAPDVTFETGVNVGLRTALGILIGAGAGAVGTALATSALRRALKK